MFQHDRHFDWHRMLHPAEGAPAVVDSRQRGRVLLGIFACLLGLILLRTLSLEITQGAAFRAELAQPLEQRRSVPARRGRILARDGTVLAFDKRVMNLAVHYRYLEQPVNEAWLRNTARRRLTGPARKDRRRLDRQMAHLRAERAGLQRRLAPLCGLSRPQWRRLARRVQVRVQRIAQSVNERRKQQFNQRRYDSAKRIGTSIRPGESRWTDFAKTIVLALFSPPEPLPPAPILVAEQLDYHVLLEDVPSRVVQEIKNHPDQYPGARIQRGTRRTYPAGLLAAHVVGYMGTMNAQELRGGSLHGSQNPYRPEDQIGRRGLERRYERLLRGRQGWVVRSSDGQGKLLSQRTVRKARPGQDLTLSLDLELERQAESLLDSALRRQALLAGGRPAQAGGAVVVMDVHSGALRVAASAPRFDPNAFSRGDPVEIKLLLGREDHPLLDRVSSMAIPPGSVFKTVTAVALLEESVIEPDGPFTCQGYLREPSRRRCLLYQRHGMGHGELTLTGALARSCNVYFFHHAGQLAPERMIEWSRRFGLGKPTGSDYSSEAAGQIPTPAMLREQAGRPWRDEDTEALAIGQSRLTVTPLQMVRLMAAVANGGKLVTPHAARHDRACRVCSADRAGDSPWQRLPVRCTHPAIPGSWPIPGLRAETLAAVRRGLEQVVAHPQGTAYRTVRLASIAIAGKTGTAQTGSKLGDHAWFAGYAPADAPEVAFVVVLQHAGEGALVAGPIAQRLVMRMDKLGYFHPKRLARHK